MSLGLKVTSDIKGRLENAARASGRTQSQEAEVRLERSFDHQELLPQVLELTYGRQLAAVLLMLGQVMKTAGESAAFSETVHPGSSFRPEGVRKWFDSPYGYDQAVRAAVRILDALRPRGNSEMPKDMRHGQLDLAYVEEHLGERVANGLLEEAAYGRSRANSQEGARIYHKMLGRLTKRLKNVAPIDRSGEPGSAKESRK